MKEMSKTWLQLFVDAMTEKDPYKRLAMVEELRKMPKPGSDEVEESGNHYLTRPQHRPSLDLNRLHRPADRPRRSNLGIRAVRARAGRDCRPKPER
jgi:hypothetical protein